MKRRDLLAKAGTLAAAGSLAGCLGTLDSPDESADSPDADEPAAGGGGTTADDRTSSGDGSGHGSGDGTAAEDDDGTAAEDDDGTAAEGDGETETSSGSEVESADEASVQSRDISTTDTGCGSTNEAAVTFDADSSTVGVDGSIAASDPCHVATVERAAVTDGRLTVVVGTRADDSDVCQQCLGQVEYEARVTFADALPSTVEVQHANRDETTTVTTASRDVRPY